ncbi:hypothetical protein AYI69_g9200, partial [Smittium culicis]
NGASRKIGTTCRTGKNPLMKQEKLDAIISSKKPEKRSQIRKPFRGSQGPLRDFSVSMDQIYGQQVGLKHRREGAPDPVPKKGTNCEGFEGKLLERLDEEAAPPTTAGGTAAADTPPVVPQKKN